MIKLDESRLNDPTDDRVPVAFFGQTLIDSAVIMCIRALLGDYIFRGKSRYSSSCRPEEPTVCLSARMRDVHTPLLRPGQPYL